MANQAHPDAVPSCDVDDKPSGWGQPETDACSMKSAGWPTFYVTWGQQRTFRACFGALGRDSVEGEADTIDEAIAAAVGNFKRAAHSAEKATMHERRSRTTEL